MWHLQLSLEYIEAGPAPNLVVDCRQQGALASQRLKKHAGRELRDSKTSFQLRSPNERCQHRLVARLLRLNGRGGRRSSGRGKRPELDETSVSEPDPMHGDTSALSSSPIWDGLSFVSRFWTRCIESLRLSLI